MTMKKPIPKLTKSEDKAMKEMMSPEEAYDKGFYQIAILLEKDRIIRMSLGMPSLDDAIHKRIPSGRGRPKKA